MTKLSPAAQAVLDAAMASAIQNLHGTYERDIAAALRAAADQVVPEQKPWNRTSHASAAKHQARCELLAIAAELDPPLRDEVLSEPC
jgi:hypothetical protein